MGALKYVEELQKKKQSDVLRFLLRVRCWEVSFPETWMKEEDGKKISLDSSSVAHVLCLAIHSLNFAESALI